MRVQELRSKTREFIDMSVALKEACLAAIFSWSAMQNLATGQPLHVSNDVTLVAYFRA
jgi:hypothetical protein